MSDGLSWPDVEALVRAWLLEALPSGVRVSTATPDTLEGVKVVKIAVSTGTDDGVSDRALLDVQTFAPKRHEARDLAEQCRDALLALGGRDGSDDGTELVDHVTTSLRPSWVDYKNPHTHRFVASYWVTTRAQ